LSNSCVDSAFLLVRIRVERYKKLYMRKNQYRYKRYYLPLRKALGDALDARVDYIVELFGPAIIALPKGLENLFSHPEKLEKLRQENRPETSPALTNSVRDDSNVTSDND